jgi:LysR family transcriptional regulator, benzoate and cis,cis-muconate-responsive activator of ben and cat genes
MIDYRQLRYFAAVADYRHFSNAAEVLHVSQSALSAQIQQLEGHLGVRLLNRNKRAAVSLTEAGEIFLAEARLALQQMERTEKIGMAAARGQVGRIEVGYVASAAISGLLPQLAATVRERFPDLELGLLQMDTPSQLRGLEDGLLDAAIIRPRPAYPPDVTATLIHMEPLRIALSANHHLASTSHLAAADLINETFIIPEFDDRAGFSDIVARLEERAGGQIFGQIKVKDFISGLTLAAGGYGVVVIPSSFQRVKIGGICFRDIDDFAKSVSLVFARKAGRESAALRSVLGIISDIAADISSP